MADHNVNPGRSKRPGSIYDMGEYRAIAHGMEYLGQVGAHTFALTSGQYNDFKWHRQWKSAGCWPRTSGDLMMRPDAGSGAFPGLLRQSVISYTRLDSIPNRAAVSMLQDDFGYRERSSCQAGLWAIGQGVSGAQLR